MLDDLPNPRLAVYIFLEMIALGFALEAVGALMHGDNWWKWTGAFIMGIVFMVLGVKSARIVERCSPYLNTRIIWMAAFAVFSLYSLYFVQRLVGLDLAMGLQERWRGALGYMIVGSIGLIVSCGYWWLAGRMITPAILSTAPTPSATPVPNLDEKPPTLLDLFKSDFGNTMKVTDQDGAAYQVRAPDGAKVDVRRQVYMDFPARTKFIGFHIGRPVPPSLDFKAEKTVGACFQLLQINAVQDSFDLFARNVGVMAGREGQMTTVQDLTFSGRVLIYHEEFLSIPQKAAIMSAYLAKHMDVQFMGDEYLGSQVIAWHQKHDPKAAH
jgi:hypothetical protein